MINNPYQQQINSYVPQYNPYQDASMSNMQRYQAQPEQIAIHYRHSVQYVA